MRKYILAGMTIQIKQAVQRCVTCVKLSESQQQQPMRTHEIPNFPFPYISMDVFFTEYQNKKNKFLVTVDHYSDYFELDALPDMSAESVIKACEKNFIRHGIPLRARGDNATNFENKLMLELGKKWGFYFVTSASKHQRGNGKAEATVKIAKRLVKKSFLTSENLWYMLLHWRNTPNKIGSSPAKRIFLRRKRNSITSTIRNLQPKIVEELEQRIEKNRNRTRFHYEQKSRQLPRLEIGQTAAVQLNSDTSNHLIIGL